MDDHNRPFWLVIWGPLAKEKLSARFSFERSAHQRGFHRKDPIDTPDIWAIIGKGMRLSNLLRSLPVGKTLNESKDQIISARLKRIVNEELMPYGEILELRVNTLDQSAGCSLRLNGETEVLDLELSHFELTKTGNLRSIEIQGQDIQTSREWLTALLHDKLGRKTVPLPEQFGWLIEFLS
jgi:hypothetical protein